MASDPLPQMVTFAGGHAVGETKGKDGSIPLGNAGDDRGVQVADEKCRRLWGQRCCLLRRPPDSARAGAAVLVLGLWAPRQAELE